MDAGVYTRPNKPLFKPVTSRRKSKFDTPTSIASESPIFVSQQTECHVTPPDVANEMVELAFHLGAKTCSIWCDPQCGTGNLLVAMLDNGVDIQNIIAVERERDLLNSTQTRIFGLGNARHACFLEESHRLIADVIITNPPFRQVRRHFEASIRSLSDTGLVVALVPETFDYPGITVLKHLGANTFNTAKVRTKIVAYCK